MLNNILKHIGNVRDKDKRFERDGRKATGLRSLHNDYDRRAASL